MDRTVAEQALVNILRGGESCGMGCLGQGNRVVTACHCVAHALKTKERVVRISKFLNPEVSVEMEVEWYDETSEFDVAVLKPKNGNEEAFREFAKHLQPAHIQIPAPVSGQSFTVHFRRHDAAWESGTAKLSMVDEGMGPSLPPDTVAIQNDPLPAVHKGTSGTPIFDDAGAVVGVMQMSADDPDTYEGIEGGAGTRPPSFTPFPPKLREFFP